MDTEHSGEKYQKLTDEELAGLLDPDLDPSERAALVERLDGDPDAVRALALAAKDIPDPGDGLNDGTIGKLLNTVRDNRGARDICPHCAGDLLPGGTFCPYCAAQVDGNPVTCFKCGKTVREGSIYCPNCGTFFRPMERKSVIEGPFLLLVLGLVSILLAIVAFAVSNPFSLVFLIIGCVGMGVWFGERFVAPWVRYTRAVSRDKVDSEREEKEDITEKTGRKSG